jgi:hypothetical protein
VPPAGRSESVEPYADIPRYTADQVIAEAKAYNTAIPSVYPQCKELPWSSEYLGQGVWIVKRFCIDGLGINRGQLERLFQEAGL